MIFIKGIVVVHKSNLLEAPFCASHWIY